MVSRLLVLGPSCILSRLAANHIVAPVPPRGFCDKASILAIHVLATNAALGGSIGNICISTMSSFKTWKSYRTCDVKGFPSGSSFSFTGDIGQIDKNTVPEQC